MRTILYMFALVIIGCGDNPEVAVNIGIHLPGCSDECEDQNPCTEDRCMANGCVHLPIDNAPCVEPGMPSGTCWDGACVCIDGAGCDDGNDCTLDGCNAGKCEHEAIGGFDPCELDGAAGTCRDGECCTGCWAGPTCREPGNLACGAAGSLCEPCDGAETCVNGACTLGGP